MSQEEFDKINRKTGAKYINNEDYYDNDFEVLLPKIMINKNIYKNTCNYYYNMVLYIHRKILKERRN